MIKKRGNLYQANFTVNGERVRDSLKTGDEVEAMKRAVALYEKLSAEGGRSQRPEDMPFGQAVDKVYDEKWALLSDPHKRGLSRLVVSLIGEATPLRMVTKDTIKQLVSDLQKDGKSPATINRYVNIATATVRHAIEEWDFDLRPLPYKRQKEPKGRLRYLSEDELARLLQAEDDRHWRAFWMAQAEIGTRRSDGNDMEWRYFDWHRGTYFVPNSKVNNPQALPLTSRLMQEFQWIRDQGFPQPFAFNLDTIRSRFDRCKRRAGIVDPKVTLNTLRHTCATQMLAEGVAIRTVQAWLGHANVATTERYAKVVPQTLMSVRDNREEKSGRRSVTS